MEATPQKILLVNAPEDGDPASALAGAGLEVALAGDGEQALAAMAGSAVALCVVWAGGEGAAELCQRIRRGPRGAVVPLLVVGGMGTGIGSRLEALEAGADSFLGREEAGRQLPTKVLTLLGLDTQAPRDPLEEALAAAAAVVPVAEERGTGEAVGGGVAVGAVSVLEVIDQVERRLGEDGPAPESADAGTDTARQGSPTTGYELPSEDDTSAPAEADLPDGVAPRAGEEPAAAVAVRHGSEPLWGALAGTLAERLSGIMSVRSGAVERRLYLEQGEVLMAVSSAREDRLVELLYREGRLTEEQYQLAVSTVGASGRRVGAVLVERGLIASRELFPLVRHHYETLVFDSFAWGECDWRFEEGARQPGERILLDVPTAALIVEGIRSRASRKEVDALVPPGCRPVLQERGIGTLEEIGLLAEEQQVLELCDGSLSTARLAGRIDMLEDELRGLLAGLVVLGWLRAEGGGGVESGEDAPVPARVTAEAGLRVERARVGEKLAAVEEGSYYAVLELPSEASGHDIRKAYRRLRAQFAAERFAVEELADLRAPAEVVRIVLEEAYEVLRDPVLREAYRLARHESGIGTTTGA